MNGHTKGPWKVEIYANGGFEVTGKGGHSGIEAYVVCSRGKHGMSNETAANARLIAAAPDLLEALQSLLRAYRESVKLWDSNHNDAFTSQAHNAIAKAIGAGK